VVARAGGGGNESCNSIEFSALPMASVVLLSAASLKTTIDRSVPFGRFRQISVRETGALHDGAVVANRPAR
jgi:hypothetical protein